jgi:hypothetical protein
MEIRMNHTRKLGISLLTAAGLALSAPLAAESENATLAMAENETSEIVTMEISGPVLVFTGNDWYTLSDGQWYGLAADGEWYPADEPAGTDATASIDDATSADASGVLYAANDGTLYSFEDGSWYIWVPVDTAYASVSEDSGYTSFTAFPDESVAYVVHLYAPDGTMLHSLSDDQWQSFMPVLAEESPSYVVYLR